MGLGDVRPVVNDSDSIELPFKLVVACGCRRGFSCRCFALRRLHEDLGGAEQPAIISAQGSGFYRTQ